MVGVMAGLEKPMGEIVGQKNVIQFKYKRVAKRLMNSDTCHPLDKIAQLR